MMRRTLMRPTIDHVHPDDLTHDEGRLLAALRTRSVEELTAAHRLINAADAHPEALSLILWAIAEKTGTRDLVFDPTEDSVAVDIEMLDFEEVIAA